MSKYIYIISEYNPPHKGHEYMISELKRIYGDPTVISVMSGNFAERGSASVVNKYVRAKAALMIGADLVLSLPFPWCSASAEFFARAGVKLADSLARSLPEAEHILAFGSECGDIDRIRLTGARLASVEFREKLDTLPSSERTARSTLSVYSEMYPDGTSELLTSPNNILAVEYVRAIHELGSVLTPVTVKRVGAGHDTDEMSLYPSASYVRECIYRGKDINGLVSDEVYGILNEELSVRGFAHEKNYGDALLGFLRSASADSIDGYAECAGGVGRRLITCANDASSMDEALTLASTKQYTNARLRRAAIYAYLGITPNDLKALPEYTSVLSANEKGTSALRAFRKCSEFAVLTKSADAYIKLSPSALRQFETDSRSDALYTLAFDPHLPKNAFSRLSPTVLTQKSRE